VALELLIYSVMKRITPAIALLFLPICVFARDVSEENRQEVAACTANIPVGSSKKVDFSWKALCKKADSKTPADLFQGEQAHYTISKKDDGLHIAAKIRFKIEPKRASASRAAFMLDRAQACMTDLNKYWQRYGITLDFTLDSDRKKTAGDPQYELTLADGTGRSHSRLHYFNGLDTEQMVAGVKVKAGPTQACLQACKLGQAFKLGSGLLGGAVRCEDVCEPFRQKEFCLMVLHETGHLLGLPDEYADPMCPDRTFVSNETNPWSAMATPLFGFADHIDLLNNQQILDLSAVEFFPRHVRAIACTLGGGQPLSAVPPSESTQQSAD
jgi:hypothetical protein